MSKYSKYNLVYRLQKWMDSVSGQTFLNYAYSWGASIVILGTLFKLTHLPLANLMLFLGMGTEVLVFFISAFDRPFDKTTDGQELMTDQQLADHLAGEEGKSETVVAGEGGQIIIAGGGVIGGGVIGGSGSADNAGAASAEAVPTVSAEYLENVSSPTWLMQQQQISPEMEEAQSKYVESLNKLNETLAKVSEQSERLTTDSQEMENLNRTLTGICKIYEMQLKGASAQIGTIDQINEQTRKMASQIERLNEIYTRMIEAMTVNMKVTVPTSNNQ